MPFCNTQEDSTTNNTQAANADCHWVEDKDGGFAIFRSTNQD